MRILQLIDSLDPGGAERMAVNFANGLQGELGFAALATTRKEGALKPELSASVAYIFLDKKSVMDFGAINRLKEFCEQHAITHIHAHGSSFFTALLLKIAFFRFFFIWHNHNGQSEKMAAGNVMVLRFASLFFNGIISVNTRLEAWAKSKLYAKRHIYLPNFVSIPNHPKPATLAGIDGKRVIHLANLRHPKGHMTLLKAIHRISGQLDGWTFHLVGKDSRDTYSDAIKEFVEQNGLKETVYLYGSRTDTPAFLAACEIGVLSSDAEGLPLALLEYGAHSKAVVCTAVGEIPQIIQDGRNGLVVEPKDDAAFAAALLQLVSDEGLRKRMASAIFETIRSEHSQKAVVGKYVDWLEKI